jgi:hypothetical protein
MLGIMSDNETIREIAKALQPYGDLLHKLAGPLAEEIGESAGLVARHYRFSLAVKMFQKTQRILKEAGITPQAIPPRLFLPIIDHASIEDDEDLHSRWAALLANAGASPNSVHPSFIEILRQLTPDDANLLDKLHDWCVSKSRRRVIPWVDPITYAERDSRVAAGENPEESFQNLLRLGLIQPDYEMDERRTKLKITQDGRANIEAELESHYEFTEFAMRFVRACRAPKTVESTAYSTSKGA